MSDVNLTVSQNVVRVIHVAQQGVAGPAGPAGEGISANLQAALDAANLPSGTNAFATMDDLAFPAETRATIGSLIVNGEPIDTPADDDKFAWAGPSSTSWLAYITWARIKITLKDYFDAIYVAATGGTIVGQYDTAVPLTPTSGGTVNVDFDLADAVRIDASALTVGQTFSITCSNLPAAGTVKAKTVIIKTGAGIPVPSYPDSLAHTALQASKRHYFSFTCENGTIVDVHEGRVFA